MAKAAKVNNRKKAPAHSIAALYISRTSAVKKLQISLALFRRLCILKGIYPREPSNKKKAGGGSTAPRTFYYRKDIQYLLHEPVLAKLRQLKTHTRKVKKAIAKREFSTLKVLESHRPEYGLSHIIKERYPSFHDALRDLDDALSTINLFATLHVENYVIKPANVEECRRLATEFQLYVIHSRLLRKAFVSIKGIYYQAEVQGQLITWIVPHAFSQNTPSDVDFRVMATFLELYTSLVGFVNYKLFTDLGVVYPLVVDRDMDRQAGGLDSFLVRSKPLMIGDDGTSPLYEAGSESRINENDDTKAPQLVLPTMEEDDSQDTDEEDGVKVEKAVATDSMPTPVLESDELPQLDALNRKVVEDNQLTQLFATAVFYINREVPRSLMEFVIKCFGGSVGWDKTAGAGSPFDIDNAKITHHIIDRPMTGVKLHDRRVYIQPQWVFDCVNAARLVDTRPYAPGETLPPHLSPFVSREQEPAVDMEQDDSEDEVDACVDTESAKGGKGASANTKEIEGSDENDDADEEDEKATAPSIKIKQKATRKETKDKQDLEDLKSTLMSKKDRYLYSRIVAAKNKKHEGAVNLAKKRKAIQKQQRRA
ncbi:hypothetical protein SeLEV6574_g07209 [Synchytrium endobioticum]|uniref:Pescadillo homolog n=1 Tax=Synchytrium endobioticum TaxID=286115 RepID=A0A507CJ07_9FUNG|nr:hypothetical protein SeLEV6574_g07209 [Synchytrium endobioticum]